MPSQPMPNVSGTLANKESLGRHCDIFRPERESTCVTTCGAGISATRGRSKTKKSTLLFVRPQLQEAISVPRTKQALSIAPPCLLLLPWWHGSNRKLRPTCRTTRILLVERSRCCDQINAHPFGQFLFLNPVQCRQGLYSFE